MAILALLFLWGGVRMCYWGLQFDGQSESLLMVGVLSLMAALATGALAWYMAWYVYSGQA